MTKLISPKILPPVALVILLAFTVLIYWPGLSGPFLLDDYASLPALGDFNGVRNLETLAVYLARGNAGPSKRPLALLSFLIDDNNWPTTPWPFKYTNLMLHLLNGLLLAWLTLLLARPLTRNETQAGWIAILSTAFWLLHPFYVSTTLYVVQRMTLLSALFVILGLLFYIHGRRLLASAPRRAYLWLTLAVGICTPLAVLSKENGVLLPLLILVMEWTVLRHPRNPKPAPAKFWTVAFLILPVFLMAGYFMLCWQGWMMSYENRPFNLGERLLTESRIVMEYLYQLFIPHLNTVGLFNENYPFSSSLLKPPTTLASVISLALFLVSACLLRTRYPFFSLAILFFFAGHLLESTLIPLELYFEHRNYLPGIFLFLPIIHWVVTKTKYYRLLVPAIALWLAVLTVFTQQKANLWGDQTALVLAWAHQNPLSVRAQRTAAIELEAKRRPDLALQQLAGAIQHLPDNVEFRIHHFGLRCHYYAVTADESTALRNRLREGSYDFSTYPLLETLVNNVINHDCHGIDFETAHEFLDALLQNPSAQAKNEPKKQIYHLQGILYVNENQPALALQNFEAALRVSPDVETGLLQAAILASHSMYEEALEHLRSTKNILPPAAGSSFISYPVLKLHQDEALRLEQLIMEDIYNKSR